MAAVGGASALLVNRRAVVSGLFVAATAAPVVATMPEPDIFEQIKIQAEVLAALMAKAHGGEWRALVDHDLHYAAVSRRLV